MPNEISPIGLMASGIPGQMASPAPMAAPAPAGAPAQQAGALDFLKSTPLGMALMQGGLSAMGGTPLGQAFGQGFGLYQQLMSQEKGSQQQEFQNKMSERKVAVAEGHLDVARDKAKTAAKNAKAALKASQMKQPRGVNKDLWKQALDTEKAAAGVDSYGTPNEVDPSMVYRRYNTMVGNEAELAYMPFGASETSALLKAADKNPDYADLLFSEAGTIYGAAKTERLRARWQKLQEKKAAEAPAEVAQAVPPAPPVPPAAPSPMGTYPTMPYQAQTPVPSYGMWNQVMGR